MSAIDRLVLGTVALGLPYGVALQGDSRQLADQNEVGALIEQAVAAGITNFDTAPSYGLAEERLGRFLPADHGSVWTKLSNLPVDGGLAQAAERSLVQSLSRLNRDRIDCLQWHNWQATLAESTAFRSLWSELRADPRIASLGASTYGVDDALAAVRSGLFEQVQIEWNLLNQGVLDAVAEEAANLAVTLALRSVFLQGVLTEKGGFLPSALAGLAAPRARAAALAARFGLTLNALALRAALDHPARPRVLIGPDRPQQLAEILTHTALSPIPADVLAELRQLDLAENPLTDPRTWRF
jgi:aryl-alcohol dehydrogenase-like predicted oxidoreductase